MIEIADVMDRRQGLEERLDTLPFRKTNLVQVHRMALRNTVWMGWTQEQEIYNARADSPRQIELLPTKPDPKA